MSTHPETLRCVLRALKAGRGRAVRRRQPRRPQRPGQGRARLQDQRHDRRLHRRGRADRRRRGRPRRRCDAPDGRLFRSFPVGRAFVDADAIVQVGVLKTHQLMRLTGGVKLTFGCIPGLSQGAAARARPEARRLRRHAARPAPGDAPALHDHRRHHRHGGAGAGQRHAARAGLAVRGARRRRPRRRPGRPHRPRSGAASTRSRPPRAAASSTWTTPYRLAGDPIEPEHGFKPVAPRPAGAPAAGPAPHGAQPHHRATPARRRGGVHASAASARRSAARSAITLRAAARLRRPRSACAATPAPRSAPPRRSTTSCRALARLFGARG